MGWKGNHYYRGTTRIASWKNLRDADGRGVLEDPARRIDWFDAFLGRNPYAALSNFFKGKPIVIDGVSYPTGEHAFHAGKATNDADRMRIAKARTADQAKQIGRSIKMRPDWDRFRKRWMKRVIAAKFTDGRAEAKVLRSTGTAKLVEGTLWNDEFWGVNLELPGRPGRNELGKMLMARRRELG